MRSSPLRPCTIMIAGARAFSIVVACVASGGVECSAQQPDTSAATMAKVKPIFEIAKKARSEKDSPTEFDAYLKMYELCRLPQFRNLAISTCYRSLDLPRADRGEPQSQSVTSMAERCPKPTDTKDVEGALEHLQFSIIQYALLRQLNANRGVDVAAQLLAKAEVHLEIAERLAPAMVPRKQLDRFKTDLATARSNIVHNKGVKAYDTILSGAKKSLQSGSDTPSDIPAESTK